MDGKDKFVRFFNHYMGTDCSDFEDLTETIEEMDAEEGDGMYVMIEVIEQYLREEE